MSNRKPSSGISGYLRIVALAVIVCSLFTACGFEPDNPIDPTVSSSPTTSVLSTNPASNPASEPTSTQATDTEPAPTETAPAAAETEPAPTETEPAPTEAPTDAPAAQPTAIEFISWPETIGRGNTATVTIKGQPNTKYSITVYYKSGPSTADGLDTKTSDADGYVTWTWKVGGRTTPGTFRITVSGGGTSETVQFTVTE